MPRLAPTSVAERITLLDILRGFAMFGVLWSNLNEHYAPLRPVTPLQYALAWAQPNLIELRFYSLLGFLFGIGFALQLTRAESRGVDPTRLFLRRMAVLLVIGVVHGTLIWGGDVLTEYALLGFVLILFRRVPPRWLLVSAAVLYMVPRYLILAPAQPFPPPGQIYALGTVWQIATQGAREYWFFYTRWGPIVFPGFLAIFLVGLWCVRANVVARLTKDRGLLFGIIVVAGTASYTMPSDFRPINNACVYAALTALLASFPAGARLLAPLAAVGRMSLTVYLMQSLVCVVLFYHYGLGWYGRVTYSGMLAITLVLFSLQILFSTLWLRRHSHGPLEDLWRSLTYRH